MTIEEIAAAASAGRVVVHHIGMDVDVCLVGYSSPSVDWVLLDWDGTGEIQWMAKGSDIEPI